MTMNKTIRTKCRYCDIDGCLGTCLRRDATHTQQTTAEATEEVENLRKSLVYVAFALHATPQYMLAQGITLIDGDTVRVSRDGWTVEASVNPHRQTAPATQQVGERVYAFRRKGLADFCTCDEVRYEELSNKPHLFETRIFYTAPQPSSHTAQAAESVSAGAAYAELPDYLICAVGQWFADNIKDSDGCTTQDVRELAEIFYGVTHEGGRESVDDALAIVKSFGPGIGGINDTYARQVLLAEEVERLRGQATNAKKTGELLMGLAVIRELTGTQQKGLEETIEAVRAAVNAQKTSASTSQPGGFDAGDMASAAAQGYRDGWTAAQADSVLEDAAREPEYLRGYRQGYEQRDAEVRGALV